MTAALFRSLLRRKSGRSLMISSLTLLPSYRRQVMTAGMLGAIDLAETGSRTQSVEFS